MQLRSTLLLSLAVAVTCVSAVACYLVRDPSPWFETRRRGIAEVADRDRRATGTSLMQSVRVVDSSGLAVDLTWRRQVSDSGRRLPLVLILGGHARGQQAIELLGEMPGVMLAAVSYPFAGDVRPGRATFLTQIPEIRRAFLDTPPALLLALDYLSKREDVDAQRVDAIGVSLGAPFVTIAAALDSRVTRVWAIHGSGGSFAPLEANMRNVIAFAPLRKIVAGIANVIIAGPQLAPERWVARIAPRHFIMVNARDDERMPLAAVQSLYASAAAPKELIWMNGRHIHGDAETVRRLVDIVLARLNGT